ncbi:tRNA (adenosine(37)-N6)-threonylcarbamoyltransferase complex ATPase subunit type 1 TsaE [Mesorhizobium sp. ZMM04-5]|uniref:tRNA threonylcarbamoyladenosine biosynthesis protein TsaE n=1 Tax=Mesorhizobium marinum TaxID=3228790 RepID=A0ABV3QYS3_9HYPH
MSPSAGETRVLERLLPDEEATARLGEDIAMALRPGDTLALAGDLGAGKTTLARGVIRAMAGEPALDVPSPTFTLVQSYETRVPLHHFDLYRLAAPSELDELGLDEMLSAGAALIEWPDRAGDRLPPDAVKLELTHDGEGRLARIAGAGPAFERIARSFAIREFLAGPGWGEAARRYFTGDASARSYETVTLPGEQPRVLMNAPRLVLGPPVRDGRPYADIAHTAQTVAAFVAIDRALANAGVSVPEILGQDLDNGFLLLSHLGAGSFLDPEGRPVAERYTAAAELLADIHSRHWSSRLEAAPGVVHQLPDFDRDAMAIEVELLVDWYVRYATGRPAGEAMRAGYASAWSAVFDRLEHAEMGLVLRDFHSPNIVWRGDRAGHDRLGILDFQDALIGPSAYDVASLALDARVTVPPSIEKATVDAYVAARKRLGAFDETAFAEAYAIMAAQRNSKILGIFVRLNERDGKPAYLQHLPRIANYLERALAHPALAELAGFYRRNGLIGDVA